ncbi:anthranilate phosphoribosyltransferase [uncultured Thiothrix sp.]|uniref:anthranilate phosphoribosyltransferase n=1 Tax=uncultured Thiothrix sp. TaxID=223185 RepID=UPI002620A2D8|nr:anthranilate phosphoribosyltransferase [uncultured Thiothrix sp.]
MSEANLALHLKHCIQKVATGPEYSKDLSYNEAYQAMQHMLSAEADPVQTAIYFIALRMKRETDEENRGTLQALIDHSTISHAAVEELVDISDPYDGFARGIPASSFVPAVLASLGVPAVVHGLETVGPKYGATHHQVLKAAGVKVDLTPQQATQQLEQLGWTYIDQASFAPALHALVPLRQRMVKRQVLTTVETMLGPIRARGKTHCMGGYVHKAYPPIYASLARQAGFATAIFVRGVEGGVIPSLQQAGRLFAYPAQAQECQVDLAPQDLGILAETRAVPLPPDLVPAEDALIDSEALATKAARLGLAALAGERGLTYDSLVYACTICLSQLRHYPDLPTAAQAVRAVLDSGQALTVFKAAQQR